MGGYTRKIITANPFSKTSGWRVDMCEFKVILNGKEVWNDVIYAKAEGNKVVLKDVTGQSREFKNCKIVEVDVNATRLVLAGA